MKKYSLFILCIVFCTSQLNGQPWQRAAPKVREAIVRRFGQGARLPQTAWRSLHQSAVMNALNRYKQAAIAKGLNWYEQTDSRLRDFLQRITPLERYKHLSRDSSRSFPGEIVASIKRVPEITMETFRGDLRDKVEKQLKRDNELIKLFESQDFDRTQADKLFEDGAYVNARDKEGLTILGALCSKDKLTEQDLEKVKYLVIDKKADLSARSRKYKMGLLHLIARRKGEVNEYERAIVKLLERKKIDLEAKGQFGLTPLLYSCLKNDTDRAMMFLEVGSSANVSISFIKNPKEIAVLLGLETLFTVVPIPLAGTVTGATYWKTRIDERQWEKGSSEFRGNTPLHIAVINDNSKLVNALIKAGADINTKNYRGWTAADYAEGKPEIMNVFESLKSVPLGFI